MLTKLAKRPCEIAKELARLSALILEKSESQDKKLEGIRFITSATESKLAEIFGRISEAENRLSFWEAAHEAQRANPAATVAQVEILQQKVDDIKNRERRKILRFVGFPKGCENNDAVSFLEETIPKIFKVNFSRGLEIKRAHRA